MRARPLRGIVIGTVIAVSAAFAPAAAQTPRDRVVPILYLPADLPFEPVRLRMQAEAVRDAQAWYAERASGWTFYADPLIVQRSRHTFAELADNDFQNWWPLPEKEFADYGMPWNDSSHIKLLLLAQGAGAWAGADSENGGIDRQEDPGPVPRGGWGGLAVIGDSSVAGVLAGVCPRRGQASWEKPEGGTAWWCNWNTYRGTIAHELGHTFGLPHPDALRPGFRCDSTVITNMQCHWAWPADSLLPFESAHLPKLPSFSRDALSAWQAATPVETPRLAGSIESFDGMTGDSILWLGGRGGGTGYVRGTRITGAGDTAPAGVVLEWRPPDGATMFVTDIGLPIGAAGRLSYRFRCGGAAEAGAMEAGAAPRTIVLPVRNGCVVESDTHGPAGLGNPRWSLRAR